MRIKLAKTAGFCMGVRRAMDIVLDAAHRKEPPVYTFGPLIHNPQALDLLAGRGIKILENPVEVNGEGTVVIRAHGVPPDQKRKLENASLEILDATCPRVKKVQTIIHHYAKKDYDIVIIGDQDHPEVVGLLGHSEGHGRVINRSEQAEELPDTDKLCVVAQTTQNEDFFEEIVRHILERFPNAEVHNTICKATHSRQQEVLLLARNVDAVVIVGGKKSGNTQRLAMLSKSTGTPTFHVETEAELDLKKLSLYSSIGVTAGASTPNWMIKKVVDHLRKLQSRKRKVLERIWGLWEFIIKTNLYLALGAASMSLTSSLIQGIKPTIHYAIISASYIFSMHLLNRYTDKAAGKFNDPPRAEFYEKYEIIFITLGVLSAILAIIVASLAGLLPFLIVSVLSILGVMYNIPILPKKLERIVPYQRLKDIPGSKTLSIAFAWGTITAIVPAFGSAKGPSWDSLMAFLFTASLVFIRSALFDMLDVQGDRVVGKETIPIIIGERKTELLISWIGIGLGLILLLFPLIDWANPFTYLLIICVAYVFLYLKVYKMSSQVYGAVFEGFIDSNFLLAGLISLTWLAFMQSG